VLLFMCEWGYVQVFYHVEGGFMQLDLILHGRMLARHATTWAYTTPSLVSSDAHELSSFLCLSSRIQTNIDSCAGVR